MTCYFKHSKNHKIKSINEILEEQDELYNKTPAEFSLAMLSGAHKHNDTYNLTRSIYAQFNGPVVIAEAASTELRRRVGQSKSLTIYYTSQDFYERQSRLFKPITDREEKNSKAIYKTNDVLELGNRNLMGMYDATGKLIGIANQSF